MLEWYPGVWEGVGEIMARHDALSELTAADTPRADSRALDPVYALAAERDLPVALHSNVTARNRRRPVHLEEIARATGCHPGTRLVWCHAGVSRGLVVPTLARDLGRLLDSRPNLFVDLSWVVCEDYLLRDGRPDPRWMGLIEDHPDRFMIGSDVTGHYGEYTQTIRRYDQLLDALKPETARRVARDNFLAILPGKGTGKAGRGDGVPPARRRRTRRPAPPSP